MTPAFRFGSSVINNFNNDYKETTQSLGIVKTITESQHALSSSKPQHSENKVVKLLILESKTGSQMTTLRQKKTVR